MSKADTCVCCGRVIPEGSQVCIICGREKPKKQRQVDRIRSMNAGGLAEFLMDFNYSGECPLPKQRCYAKNCTECVKHWLEQEVEE